jgi:peptidoglycan hydrolase-like protein with peptidoglycan-binding domain
MLVFRRNEICSPGSIFNLLTGERCFNANSEPRSFTKDLKFGMNDIQVKLLQQYLNSHGFPVANKGIGSLNNETTYFGSATRSAVIRFQISKKIQPSLGYFGPVTRKFVLEK